MEIEHFEGLNRTPALRLAVRGWHYMQEGGFASDTVSICWDHNAVVAYDEKGESCGVLTYAKTDHLKEWCLYIGYVVPEHRHKGVYTALWRTLHERAYRHGVAAITSRAAMSNQTIRDIAQGQGQTERVVTLEYKMQEGSRRGK